MTSSTVQSIKLCGGIQLCGVICTASVTCSRWGLCNHSVCFIYILGRVNLIANISQLMVEHHSKNSPQSGMIILHLIFQYHQHLRKNAWWDPFISKDRNEQKGNSSPPCCHLSLDNIGWAMVTGHHITAKNQTTLPPIFWQVILRYKMQSYQDIY